MQELIQLLQNSSGEDELSARLTVLHDLADLEADDDHWRDALGGV